MAKLTLNDVGSLIDTTTAQNTINTNNTSIETAMEKTLSRDGTSPNTMGSNFDMNSYRVLNLPDPINDSEPVTLRVFNAMTTAAGNVPSGGTTSQILKKNSNTSYDTGWTTPLSSVGLALPSDFNITGSPVTSAGTLTGAWALTPTGTGSIVRAISPIFTTPTLGTPVSGNLVNCTGVTVSVGSITGLGTGVSTFLGTPSSANLATAMTDETGSGSLVFGTTPTLTTPVINGTPTGTGISTSATANTLVLRDASANSTSNNVLSAYATTVTAAGTTTLTVASPKIQFFTGSTTQTVTLPVTSTLALGFDFYVVNDSTGVVTVNSSGGNGVLLIPGGGRGRLICILTSGTTAASWGSDTNYIGVPGGKRPLIQNSLTFTGTDGQTIPFGTRTQQVFTSGTGATYTTPANVKYIIVRMAGGGGGGGGSGTGSPGNGTAGNNSSFSTFTAGGGAGGASGGLGGAGGTATGGGQNFNGTAGLLATTFGTSAGGGSGACAPFFGGGGVGGGVGPGAGGVGATNSGGGGGGGGYAIGTTAAGGGGSGSFVEALVTAPSATYTYTVGAAANGGAAGTNGAAGGNGAAGRIIVDEFYQ